jgi:hypothetical protein
MTSHLGLSGSRSSKPSMIAAGTAAMPMDHGHGMDCDAPMIVAITMPTPMAIWKHRTRRPR